MNKNIFIFSIVIILLIGCNSSNKGTEAQIKETSAEADYNKYCVGCHGENLKKFKALDWKTESSTVRMFNAIKNGIQSEGMPAYDSTFTDTRIQKLVAYLKKRKADPNIEEKKKELPGTEFKSEEYDLVAVKIADNLEIPWAMQMLPSGEILFTEKKGTLKRLFVDGKMETISGLPKVRDNGQGGLLDIKLHPDFIKNQLVYLSYSKPQNQNGNSLGTTAVIMAKLVGNELQNVREIFEAKPYVGASHHYAGRLQFDNDGHLFISVGDRGNENQHPQFLTNFNGKIHRINDDGSIPSDNPFVNDKSVIQSIYSYGHRNPQGLAMREDGSLWENEHGPQGGDEINKIIPGRN